MLRIIARVARYGYGFSDVWVHEVPMVPFSSTVDEARPLEFNKELSHLRWHSLIHCPSFA